MGFIGSALAQIWLNYKLENLYKTLKNNELASSQTTIWLAMTGDRV